MIAPAQSSHRGQLQAVPRPPAQAWRQLCASLLQIAENEREGLEYEGAPPGFMASEAALHAVLTFLQSSDGLMRAGAVVPVLRLRAAVRDLQEGRQPALLKPRSRGGRPGTDHRSATIIGFAARALDELVTSGAAVNDAARTVCECMRKGRAIGWQAIKPATIKNWRNRCREGEGADIAPLAIKHFREPLPRGMGATAAIRGQNLLLVLSEAAKRGLGE